MGRRPIKCLIPQSALGLCNRKKVHVSEIRTGVQICASAQSDLGVGNIQNVCEIWTFKHVHPYCLILVFQPAVAQLDACPTGDQVRPPLGWQHFFVEIDHEIFSTFILSLSLIQEGQLSVSGERMCTILVNRLEN